MSRVKVAQSSFFLLSVLSPQFRSLLQKEGGLQHVQEIPSYILHVSPVHQFQRFLHHNARMPRRFFSCTAIISADAETLVLERVNTSRTGLCCKKHLIGHIFHFFVTVYSNFQPVPRTFFFIFGK